MFRNYFKTSLRNLSRNKFFAAINIFGLALGMSVSLIFVAMLAFIYRYDNFHPNRDRIYRVITHVQDNQDNPSYASAPFGTAQLLKDDFLGIEKVVRIEASLYGNALYNEKEIPIGGYFAEPDFLTVFNFPLLQGDVSTALTKPNSIIITKTLAEKVFGSKDPIGEAFTIPPFGEVLITGVLADIPKNSHMQFDAIASYSTLISYHGWDVADREDHWTRFINSYVYILLPEKNNNVASIEQYLARVAKDKYASKDVKASFELQNLKSISPGPPLNNSIGMSWDYFSLTLIGLMLMVILIPACSNYIQLAIAQSLRRMKEIGVRKVMGGQKKQIFAQFVMETTITMFLSLALAYIFYELIRGEALDMMGNHDSLDLSPTLLTIVCFILFAFFVGLVAGIAPALYLSRISPISALKGKEVRSGKRGGISFKKIMITTQFILSLGFIMGVMIMLQQYRFSSNYDLGFDQKNILDVEMQHADPQLFKNEFGKLSSVQAISLSSHRVGLESDMGYVKYIDQADSIEASSLSVDENFISNMKLNLLAGRNFSTNTGENSHLIIINEELAKKLNVNDPAATIDKVLLLPGGREVHVAGIVKNFHYTSLKKPIASFYFEYDPERFNYANIRVSSNDRLKNIASMESAWKALGEDDKLQAQFLTDEVNDAYSYYIMIVKFWGFLGLLAITVACLGLLGTVVFTIRNRLKEVSLRKVMGASSESLVFLLSKDFMTLMLIASLITVPTMYFAFNNWLLVTLQHYRAEIGAFEILVSLSIMFCLGLGTILSQTLRAANMNPVDNLRVE